MVVGIRNLALHIMDDQFRILVLVDLSISLQVSQLINHVTPLLSVVLFNCAGPASLLVNLFFVALIKMKNGELILNILVTEDGKA